MPHPIPGLLRKWVAQGRFDTHDVSPVVGQEHRGHWAGHAPGQIENAQMFECSCHTPPPLDNLVHRTIALTMSEGWKCSVPSFMASAPDSAPAGPRRTDRAGHLVGPWILRGWPSTASLLRALHGAGAAAPRREPFAMKLVATDRCELRGKPVQIVLHHLQPPSRSAGHQQNGVATVCRRRGVAPIGGDCRLYSFHETSH